MSLVLAPGSYSIAVRLNCPIAFKLNLLIDKQVGVGVFKVIKNKSTFEGIVDLQAKACQNPSQMEKHVREIYYRPL